MLLLLLLGLLGLLLLMIRLLLHILLLLLGLLLLILLLLGLLPLILLLLGLLLLGPCRLLRIQAGHCCAQLMPDAGSAKDCNETTVVYGYSSRSNWPRPSER